MGKSERPVTPPFFFKAPTRGVGYYVEGNELVVRDGIKLPAVCVKTNQPVSIEDLTKEEFTWCSPWIALLFAVSGPLLIIAYFLVRKRCSMTYGLHPDFRARRRRRMTLKVMVAASLFIALLFLPALNNDAVIAIAVIVLIISIIAIFVGNAPLRITKHSEGRFWIRGFSPEYLATLSTAA
jgi:hypothetical protein